MEQLVTRFSRYVYAITSRVYRLGEHDAEDVFQDVFARTYERLGELRRRRGDPALDRHAHRRLCVDRLRAGGREQPMDEPIDPGEADNAIETLDGRLPCTRVSKALPEHCDEILDRFFARDRATGRSVRRWSCLPGRSPAVSPAAWGS